MWARLSFWQENYGSVKSINERQCSVRFANSFPTLATFTIFSGQIMQIKSTESDTAVKWSRQQKMSFAVASIVYTATRKRLQIKGAKLSFLSSSCHCDPNIDPIDMIRGPQGPNIDPKVSFTGSETWSTYHASLDQDIKRRHCRDFLTSLQLKNVAKLKCLQKKWD